MAAKKKTAPAVSPTGEIVTIRPANMKKISFDIVGTAPYVQHKFSAKARRQMVEKQMAGSTAKGKKKQDKRDPRADCESAIHFGPKGVIGIPATAFRSACISACRLVGFQMTKAKLSVFVEPDFFDEDDGTPLVKIKGDWEMHEGAVRLETGVASVAFRPMWKNWSATVCITYDGDQFTSSDVTNLMSRAGLQVGIGEGRADSKRSHGCGWGSFAFKGGR